MGNRGAQLRGDCCALPTPPPLRFSSSSFTLLTSLLVMNVMETSSLTVVVATLGPGGSNSELPNFFQFFLLATAFDAFRVSILKVLTI